MMGITLNPLQIHHFDATEYFKENFGILVHDDTPIQRIVVRAYGMVRFYVRDLPLHHSQRKIVSTDEYADFELNLRPTIDFSNHLMTYTDGLKVLSPQWLADEMYQMHLNSAQFYEEER
ncbi:MAG: WYL domain-containing protein [Alloprevotella sp.]|nr:WYL domain-containing protein [Alloprevotella sp.]